MGDYDDGMEIKIMEKIKDRLFDYDSLYIAVDFDGTIVEQNFPHLSEPIPGAIETILELQQAGHKIILWTCRSHTEKGDPLQQAINYLKDRGINLWAVNNNPEQPTLNYGPKLYANIYIDDLSIGCPLIYPEWKRPYVDWAQIRNLLVGLGILSDED